VAVGEEEPQVCEFHTPEILRVSLPMTLCRALLEKAGIKGEPTESALFAALEQWV